MDTVATLVEPAGSAPNPTELRSLRELAASLPGGRGCVAVRTLTRWIVLGVMLRGQTIRLRAQRVGGSWRTCPAWIEEFFTGLTAAATAPRKS